MSEENAPQPETTPADAIPAIPETKKAFAVLQGGALEMPDLVREIAEKSVTGVKDAYESVRSAAEEATDMMEDTYETARKGFVDMNLKIIDHVQANADRAFAFAKEMMMAKSMSEAVELQTRFAREQFEHMANQAREFQEVATHYASETSAPMKEAWERTAEKFKAA